MMRVLLDANVILDSLLQRVPWRADSDAILAAAAPDRLELALSTLTVSNAFYVGRKIIGTAKARAEVRAMLSSFLILPVDRGALVAADSFLGVEDNIQIAAAVAAGLNIIVTRDPAGFVHSPVTVLSPTQLVARLAQGRTPPTS